MGSGIYGLISIPFLLKTGFIISYNIIEQLVDYFPVAEFGNFRFR